MEHAILSSDGQSKEWRLEQSWYTNGKQNECELFQKQCVHQITGLDISTKTNMRLRLDTLEMVPLKNPLAEQDGFEYTEDMDGIVSIGNMTLYFNLKFVCGVGGAQNRTLRETYHFINAQLQHLLQSPDDNKDKYFINILDGDGSHCHLSKFRFLLEKDMFQEVKSRVFVGDTHQFELFWKQFSSFYKNETTIPMKTKRELGQFYTTNYQYILQNLHVPETATHIIEPFVGAGDLLPFLPNMDNRVLETYDIDPQDNRTIPRDTLMNPPCYKDKFVITNPPYLARNKSKDKTVFDKYGVNDLYKCFLQELIRNPCAGGIVIVPTNFWCSRRENDMRLRKQFLQTYTIPQLNFFEESVFLDTDYSVCSFQFSLRRVDPSTPNEQHEINMTIFPDKRQFRAILHQDNFYMVGGEIFRLAHGQQYEITRWTRLQREKTPTQLLVKCIDDDTPIHMSIAEPYLDDTANLSARSYATLVIEPSLSVEEQKVLADRFNTFLNGYRTQYASLFLPTYREHKRKRISFDLVYHIVKHLLSHP